MTFQNVEPKIGNLNHFYVNMNEARYLYTRGDSELHVCDAETVYVPKHLMKLDLSQTTRIKRDEAFRDILFMVEHRQFLMIFKTSMNKITLFHIPDPQYKLSIENDFSPQLGKNPHSDDIRYLSELDAEQNQDMYSFYVIVKSEIVVRLVKMELQTGYILKTISKLKEQDSGTFSQLLPATLKVSVHSVFQVEPRLFHMKAASLTRNKYVMTLQSEDSLTLYINIINTEQKKMKPENKVELTSPIHKIDISQEYPYYITIVDMKKKVI